MKRREFLKTSIAATAMSGLAAAEFSAGAATLSGGAASEYYELRAYRLHPGPGRDILDGYLSQNLIPLLNKLGSKPIGVFAQQPRTGAPDKTEVRDQHVVFMLIPYDSLEAFGNTTARIQSDEKHKTDGARYLQAPKDAPAFDRIETSLMRAFNGMPRLEQPAYSKEKKTRMFEMRYYASHSEIKALKKMEMFNSGEIEVMHQVGLAPIFYGQVIVGHDLPRMTYMLSAENQEEHKKHWEAFGKNPIWNKMKNDPQYADTVSNISNRFLVPTAYSQI